MQIPQQIDIIGLHRVSNAAHYEYLTLVQKRTQDIPLAHPLWQQAVEEFNKAFAEEDTAFRQYTASLKTEEIAKADAKRDKLFAALRDSIKAYVKFPIADVAEAGKRLKLVLDNYKFRLDDNYMVESGIIDNILQDFQNHATDLVKLNLTDLATQLREANDYVRKLLADRNEERSTYVIGALKTARKASDKAYAIVLMHTNAYLLLNPDRREAIDLMRLLCEDFEYLRKHAFGPSSKKEDGPVPPIEREDTLAEQ